MLPSILSGFYERDIRRLIEEVSHFREEDNLWKTIGDIHNSAGNLALHIIGGTNYFFGTVLSNSGYIRDRDREFTQKNVPQLELLRQLQNLIPLIKDTLSHLPAGRMEDPFPINFDGASNAYSYVLIQLLAHLNYHLGQINYLRRMLEPWQK